MTKRLHRLFILLITCSWPLAGCVGQVTETDPYIAVAYSRAEKIVAAIDLGDNEAVRPQAVKAVAEQYRNLHRLDANRDQSAESSKGDYEAALKDLHFAYIAQLLSLLSPEQVDLIKDGMTYNVAKNTYRVYMDMIPDLNDEQKAHIRAWLLEAREHAMDGGSSDEKHAWFGKYKGRINNYLSQLGYDLKQAEQDMWKRKQAGESEK